MIGFNDNPTAQQFEAAYRKLLIHNDVVCSNKSNCIDLGTKILTVSSNRPREAKQIEFDDEEFDDFFSDADYEDCIHVAQYVDDAQSHSIAYMASVLESKIMKAKPAKPIIKCSDCVAVFIENELIEDSFIRFKARKTNMMQPCKSTFEICKYVDTFVKSCEGKSASYQTVAMKILRNLPFETLYANSEFENHASGTGTGHQYELVKKIIEMYMHMKSVHIAKCFTLKSHDAPIRHKFKKLIHQKGQ